MLSGTPSLSESMRVELVPMICSSQSGMPSQSLSTPRSAGGQPGSRPPPSGSMKPSGLKLAPSLAKCTSTPSLNPSPSVSRLLGSVPSASSSSSVRPSRSLSPASGGESAGADMLEATSSLRTYARRVWPMLKLRKLTGSLLRKSRKLPPPMVAIFSSRSASWLMISSGQPASPVTSQMLETGCTGVKTWTVLKITSSTRIRSCRMRRTASPWKSSSSWLKVGWPSERKMTM